jgi:hypothetical protein
MTDYFYVITLQNSRGAGTLKGVHEAPSGETAEQAFDSILAWALKQSGFNTAVVLFFSLEPNTLGGPR